MNTHETKPHCEFRAIRGETVNDLVFDLEILSAEQWEPRLYLGGGVVLLERPFTGNEPVLDDEVGDIDLTGREPEGPLLEQILAKYGPHTRRKRDEEP